MFTIVNTKREQAAYSWRMVIVVLAGALIVALSFYAVDSEAARCGGSPQSNCDVAP